MNKYTIIIIKKTCRAATKILTMTVTGVGFDLLYASTSRHISTAPTAPPPDAKQRNDCKSCISNATFFMFFNFFLPPIRLADVKDFGGQCSRSHCSSLKQRGCRSKQLRKGILTSLPLKYRVVCDVPSENAHFDRMLH